MARTTTAVAKTKVCSTCGRRKPIAAFAHKSVERGTRQAKCRECTSAYNREHHAEHKKDVNPRVHAIAKTHRTALTELANAARAAATCGTCGAKGADGADIILVPPHELTGGRRMADIIRAGWSTARFEELLRATTSARGGTICRTCVGRTSASRPAESAQLAGT